MTAYHLQVGWWQSELYIGKGITTALCGYCKYWYMGPLHCAREPVRNVKFVLCQLDTSSLLTISRRENGILHLKGKKESHPGDQLNDWIQQLVCLQLLLEAHPSHPALSHWIFIPEAQPQPYSQGCMPLGAGRERSLEWEVWSGTPTTLRSRGRHPISQGGAKIPSGPGLSSQRVLNLEFWNYQQKNLQP